MKKILAALAILAALPLAHAEWFQSSQGAVIDVRVEGRADILKESAKARVERVVVNLSLFPREDLLQYIMGLETEPRAEMEGDRALFAFQKPEESISYSASARVETSSRIIAVKQKIPFPLRDLPDSADPYLQSTETIDAEDPDIIRAASQLVEGEDDLYGAVHSIARWTRENVNYNLSTLTAEVSQKASWVLLERKGVCDEITSLFIAMLRAVGIPAKFVTGYAYTNSPLFPAGWGAHGWAEVYFPGYGWVPFDVTYGEFGYLDAGHVKMKESVDPDEASTRYEWVGRDVGLTLHELNVTAEVVEFGGRMQPAVLLKLRPLKEEVGFSSYNGIEAVVSNLLDAYVMTELVFSAPKEVKVIGSGVRDILLKPGEQRPVFWVVRLDSALEESFAYTFPVTVSASRNESESASFRAVARGPSYTLQDIGAVLDQRVEEEEKVYSASVTLNCTSSRKALYEYEGANITCTVRNTGNRFLEGLLVCAGSCATVDIGISQEKAVSFAVNTSLIGRREEAVKARNPLVSKAEYLPIEVKDAPALEIVPLSAPASVEFEDSFSIMLGIERQSYSPPENVRISAEGNGLVKRWRLDSLEGNITLEARFRGSDLRKGQNALLLSAVYEDGNGREYASRKDVVVALERVTFPQELSIILKGMRRSLERQNPETWAAMLLVSVVIFVGVVATVFRRRR